MTRVWLNDWEWACCGRPFAVGDEVDFGIRARMADPFLTDLLGEALAATVDAVESHHEEEFVADRVRGRVVAVNALTHEVEERRSLRRPGHGAPPDAVMPPEGEEWPMVTRDLGGGAFAGSRPSRYVTEIVPVPDTAALEPVPGVRLEAGADVPDPSVGGPPRERTTRAFAGWLVDVEDQ